MAREKATITVDRSKLAEARTIFGVTSSSEAIDRALGDVVRRARLRSDVEAYLQSPTGPDERALMDGPGDWSDLVDDTDWDSLWPET